MDERQQRIWSRVKLWTCNAFIAVVLLLIVIDGFPFSPQQLRDLIDPVLDKSGLYQGEWSMFSPPDSVNTRLSADIEYQDGTMAQWQSPDWRRLSYFDRFLASRRLEYLEKSGNLGGVQFWPELVEYMVRTHPGPHPESGVKHVKIWIQTAEIPDPRAPAEDEEGQPAGPAKWQTWKEPPPFGEKNLLYQRSYQ